MLRGSCVCQSLRTLQVSEWGSLRAGQVRGIYLGGCTLTPVRKPELVTHERSCLCWLPSLTANSKLSRSSPAMGGAVVIPCRCLAGVEWPLISCQESRRSKFQQVCLCGGCISTTWSYPFLYQWSSCAGNQTGSFPQRPATRLSSAP